MSEVASATAMNDPTAPAAQTPSTWAERFHQVEALLAALSDRLNPILVKETRQALKSRQFGFTLVLLLILCWVVTIGGVAMVGPGIYYSAAGSVLLKAYLFVLIFPLAVVVPFSAYRSLTTERDENTYDLLRVSTLNPHQVVRGKLGSAGVLMGVYLSAVAPCVAFTYLLRGVDVLTVAVLLLYITLASLGLSLIGLFLAAITSKKHGQVLVSVAFVALLLACFFGGLALTSAVLDEGGQLVSDPEFWIVTGVLFTLYATTFAIVYLATVALTSYRSENRSTALRYAMVVQQAAFIGWMSAPWLASGYDDDVLMVAVLLAVVYWYFMGALMTTEVADLSHRVRRRLPQSTFGKVLLGLFNPGPGTGYMFTVANLTTVMLLVGLALGVTYYFRLATNRTIHYQEIILVGLIYWSYVVAYVGIGKLVIGLLRRFTAIPGIAGFLIHVLLLLAVSGVPFVTQISIRTLRNAGYTALQWSNPFWTFKELIDRGPRLDAELWLQAMVLLTIALCVLLANLPSAAREMMQDRVALPSRVAEDEAELHPVEARPQSPWDQDPPVSLSPEPQPD